MIRLIRETSPWIIKGLIGAIAITFIGGMGWYGYEASQPNAVATVGPYTVDRQEYLRAKQRYYRFYRDQLKQEEVKDETIQQLALDGLITNKSWRVLADEFGLAVPCRVFMTAWEWASSPTAFLAFMTALDSTVSEMN